MVCIECPLATGRVREYGLRPVEGDLVLKQVDDPSRLLTLRYVHCTYLVQLKVIFGSTCSF